MLTIFSTPKPFRGHIDIIQRNAIQSWKCIHRDVEIILFGDEDGAAEVAGEFGLRHVPHVPKNRLGTKLLRGFFEPAQQLAQHELLCYVNCDIMLLPSFAPTLERVLTAFPRFLMVGQRWNMDITQPWNFNEDGWDRGLAALVAERGWLTDPTCIDYFAFPRGLYRDMPALVIGRIWWDHWLVWRARSLGTPVVDATETVMAVHQNHDYSYHPHGAAGVWQDEQSRMNLELAGGKRHLYTIEDSTHRLTPSRIKRNLMSPLIPLRRAARPYVFPLWHGLLDVTRPIRHRFGLRHHAAGQTDIAKAAK